MGEARRPYRREPSERRRDDLIAAALAVMAEAGPGAMTVRTIAERAGISAGLIRHHFRSKEDLIRAAFAAMMDRMTETTRQVAEQHSGNPQQAIAALVSSSLRPPVMEPERIGQWAGFLNLVRQDPVMRDLHEAAYLKYRDMLQAHIQQLPGKEDPRLARHLAIACNGVIDGLWLEGGTLPHSFAPGEVERIGLSAVSSLLGIDLLAGFERE